LLQATPTTFLSARLLAVGLHGIGLPERWAAVASLRFRGFRVSGIKVTLSRSRVSRDMIRVMVRDLRNGEP